MLKSDEKTKNVQLEGSRLTMLTELSAIVATMRAHGIPEQAIDGAIKVGHKAFEKFGSAIFKEGH